MNVGGEVMVSRANLGEIVPAPSGSGPSGTTDWRSVRDATAQAILTESDNNKKAILSSALGIATAAIPIPVAGWIVAAATAVLTLFGITIRGRTEHINEGVAQEKARGFAAKIGEIYQSVPQDAKERMFELVAAWEGYMYGTFASWWGQVIGRGRAAALSTRPSLQLSAGARSTGTMTPADWSAWVTTVYGGNKGAWIVDVVGYYFQVIMHQADVASVDANMKTWYFDPLASYVLQPLDAYMIQKYNATVEQYRAAGGTGLNTISMAGIGWIMGAGLLIGLPLFLSSGKKARAPVRRRLRR